MAFGYNKAFFGVMKGPSCSTSMENLDSVDTCTRCVAFEFSILVRSQSVKKRVIHHG